MLPDHLKNYFSLSTVPQAYKHMRLANFEPRTAKQRAALAAIHRVRESDSDFMFECPIILCGPCGVGKTHLAVGVLYAEAAADEPEGREDHVFASYSDLARRWADRKTHAEDLARLTSAWQLVIDDLMPPRCEAEADAVAALIDVRHRENALRLVITTNMAPVEIRQFFGDRTADRLKHGALILTLDGASQRKPANLAEWSGGGTADTSSSASPVTAGPST